MPSSSMKKREEKSGEKRRTKKIFLLKKKEISFVIFGEQHQHFYPTDEYLIYSYSNYSFIILL